MNQKQENGSAGLPFDLIVFPALGSKVHMLRIKIPARNKWAKRYYLDVVCYGA